MEISLKGKTKKNYLTLHLPGVVWKSRHLFIFVGLESFKNISSRRRENNFINILETFHQNCDVIGKSR